MDTKSRYYPWGTLNRAVYSDGAPPGSDPIRTDRVIRRRPTTWADMPGTTRIVTVHGDTMFNLAARHLGDVRYWDRIADFNPHVLFPLDLEAKTVLIIPPANFVGRRRSVL